jgi:hypothetical protein
MTRKLSHLYYFIAPLPFSVVFINYRLYTIYRKEKEMQVPLVSTGLGSGLPFKQYEVQYKTSRV